MNSDAEIMQRVKSGQVDSLGLLFERYKQPLFAFFFRNTHCRQNSEDLVQTVFLRILKYRNSYSEKGSFKTWMYQIAHHVHVDHYHKNARYTSFSEASTESLYEDDQSAEIDKHEQLDLLNLALAKLETEKRELLILAKYQQLKYKEIAEIYNISESNVKVKVFRALLDLKAIYAELEQEHVEK